MIKCDRCGNEGKEGTKFCPKCGSKVTADNKKERIK